MTIYIDFNKPFENSDQYSEEANEDLKKENEDLKKELSDVTEENNDLRNKITEIEQLLQEKDIEIDKLIQENNSLKTSCDIEQMNELKKENEIIKAELLEVTEENRQLSKELNETQQNKKASEIKLNQLVQDNDALKKSLNEQSNKIKELKTKAHELLDKPSSAQSSSSSPLNALKILSEKEIENLERIQEIGSGGGGKVFKVATRKIQALKEMNMTDSGIENLKHFVAEYEIMNILDHPNILKAFGIFFGNETQSPKILLEFCPNSLDKAIKNKSLSNIQIVISIYQIAEGMKYVHFQKVIHRDLKPSNILIDDDGTIKICDFGISKLMSTEEQQTMTVGVGTQKFMAPEIVDESDYNEKVDVFSFGVLVFYVLNGGDITKIKLSDILRGKPPQIPDQFTEFATKIVSSCLSFDASNRPSFESILNEMEANDFNLVELSKYEVFKVKKFVSLHKNKIPQY